MSGRSVPGKSKGPGWERGWYAREQTELWDVWGIIKERERVLCKQGTYL